MWELLKLPIKSYICVQPPVLLNRLESASVVGIFPNNLALPFHQGIIQKSFANDIVCMFIIQVFFRPPTQLGIAMSEHYVK